MLAKVNCISNDNRIAMITKLDIDDFGSVVPIKELELRLPADDSVIQILRNSPYAAIFTDSDDEEDGRTMVIANGISTDELNREKERTIEKMGKSKEPEL